ncbi:MAG TPA: transporter [Burkholderiales bacterium]
MKNGWAARCAFAFGIGAAPLCFGADGEFSAGAGVNYSTGKYGTSTQTKILSIPFSARYETELWSFKLTVPYLRVTSPANVIPGVGRFDSSGRPRRRAAGTTSESGLGDTVASATYNAYYDAATERGLDLTGRVKLPTAEAEKGLGTGSTDESVQLDVYQAFDRLTLFADVGYTFFGHSDFVRLDNAFNAGIGASNKVSATDSVGASLDARQRVTPDGAPQRELSVFWNHRTDSATRMQAYVLVGLAKGSPDRGLGLSLLRAF